MIINDEKLSDDDMQWKKHSSLRGIPRLISAYRNSMNSLKATASTEYAIRCELWCLALSLPIVYLLHVSLYEKVALVLSILLVLIVEILNTAIEHTCDAISIDFDINIKKAKDCGSLAVLFSVLIALSLWTVVIINSLFI